MLKSLFSFVSTLCLLSSLTAEAQSFYAIRRERSLIATVGAGSANYFGELVNPGTLGELRPGLNVGLEHALLQSRRITGRVEATWFRISGDDANADDDRVVRNLSFFSNNIEIASTIAFSLFPAAKRFYQRPTINFYGFVGFGMVYINPKTQYNGETVALQPLQTEGVRYSRFQPIVPLGAGIKLKVSPFVNFSLETGLRKTFTDYLDDISIRRYPDPATLGSDLARALSNRSDGQARVRGNPENDDWYMMVNARVQYYLPFDFMSNSNRKLYSKKRKTYNSRRRR